MSESIVTRPLIGLGEGIPDYKQEVTRAKSLWGYMPEVVEDFFFAIIVCSNEFGGAYNFTRAALAAGDSVDLVDAFTGLAGITPLAGEDYLIKEFWISFDRPVRFQMIQDVYNDLACELHVPSYNAGFLNGFPIGWTRSQVEPIAASTRTTLRITNEGDAPTVGKAWIVGFRKMGQYTWF